MLRKHCGAYLVEYSCDGYFRCVVEAEKKSDVEENFLNGDFEDIEDLSQNFTVEKITLNK